MSFELLTNENLNTISTADIASYLKAHGWRLLQTALRPEVKTGNTFLKNIGDKEHDVFVPKNSSYSDYTTRIKDILEELQKVEKRTPEKIFYDIKYTAHDIIRFRIIHPSCASGELPIDGNSKLIEAAKEIIATSVHSLFEKKAYYQRRTPSANDYIKKVHVAQSEVGSYILKITVPIPPAQRLPLIPDEDPATIEDPIERNVTKNLMTSINNCLTASEEAILDNGNNPLTSSYEQGVNANLLFAIAKMGEIFEGNDLEVSTTWSSNRPAPIDISNRALITRDHIQYIKEAARILKDTTPLENFELVGHVTKLEGSQGTRDAGKATITGIVDNHLKNVKVELSPADHEAAHAAYAANSTVSCTGELKKENRSYTLINPRSFRVLIEPELI